MGTLVLGSRTDLMFKRQPMFCRALEHSQVKLNISVSAICYNRISPMLSLSAATQTYVHRGQDLKVAGVTSMNHRKNCSYALLDIEQAKGTVVRPETQVREEEEDLWEAFWDYQRLFVSQRCEVIDEIQLKLVEGRVPDELKGCYYLAGPGLFKDDHGSSVHPMDGHGYLRKFRISSNSVHYSARYVETEAKNEEYDKESDRWKFMYRGVFSVLKCGERVGNMKVMKNVANTSVLWWAGRLMCLWEGGHPYEVDSASLSTIGPSRMTTKKNKKTRKTESVKKERKDPMKPTQKGKLGLRAGEIIKQGFVDFSTVVLRFLLEGTLKMPRERVLSHFKIDSRRRRLVILTCESQDMLLPNSNMCFYGITLLREPEFDWRMRLVHKRKFMIKEHTMIHDWALTHRHYIIFANRVKLNVSGSVGAVFGLTPMISALVPDDDRAVDDPFSCRQRQGTPVYIFPRFSADGCENAQINNSSASRDWRLPIDLPQKLWVLHIANAFEEEKQEGNHGNKLQIVVHACVCSYKWFSFTKMFGYDHSKRLLDPAYMNMNSNAGDHPSTPHLVKISVTLDCNGESSASVNALRSWTKSCDFPSINNAVSSYKNKYMYAAANSSRRRSLPLFPFDSILKINVIQDFTSTWWAGKRSFVGEPTFVPKPNISVESEDDGYIIFVQYAIEEQRCYLVILDAKKLDKGEEKVAMVARLEIPPQYVFPLGFHGFWASA